VSRFDLKCSLEAQRGRQIGVFEYPVRKTNPGGSVYPDSLPRKLPQSHMSTF
jgi:hypothetical protein